MIPLRDTLPSRTFPAATLSIIALNVMVFLYEVSLDQFSANHFILRYGVVPARLQLMDLLTNLFLHGGWMHLLGNMWFLWIYGDNVEDILGRWRYVLFYILCGVAASLTHVFFNPASRLPSIGASGAIAGVMGAYLVSFPHARVVTLVPIFLFFTTIEIPAYIMLIYWFVLQIFNGAGSVVASNINEGGTAWFAHIGGFLAGILLVKIMPTNDPWRRRPEMYW